jgi:hypothetical protein
MATDTPEQRVLPPRAAVALLTLQLRGLEREIAEAERAAAAVDPAATRDELRAKLAGIVDERRRALAAELEAARVEAAGAIAAAHAEAARAEVASTALLVDQAPTFDAPTGAPTDVPTDDGSTAVPESPAPSALAAPAVGLVDRIDPDEVEVVFDAPIEPAPVDPPDVARVVTVPVGAAPVPPPPVDRSPTDPSPTDPWPTEVLPITPTIAVAATGAGWAAPAADATRFDEPADLDTPRTTSLAGLVTAVDGDTRAVNVVIDAESFARAFAAAIAPVIEARAQQPPVIPESYFRALPSAPAKKGFWSHAWHPDVLLSLLAMIIVLVVLVAWAG